MVYQMLISVYKAVWRMQTHSLIGRVTELLSQELHLPVHLRVRRVGGNVAESWDDKRHVDDDSDLILVLKENEVDKFVRVRSRMENRRCGYVVIGLGSCYCTRLSSCTNDVSWVAAGQSSTELVGYLFASMQSNCPADTSKT